MAKQPDYADRLRETLLALAIVPIAGLDTATYWLKESLDRTSRFGADVIVSTALARFTRPRDAEATGPDPVADVLAQDLLDAARTYVRAMVRLPADSGVYFTGELERRLNALLERIQPEADKDLPGYADGELQRLLQELDRLFVVIRAEARRATSAESRQPLTTLVADLENLRAGVKQARSHLPATPRAVLSLELPPSDDLRAFKAQKARTRLLEALREVEALAADDRAALEGIGRLIGYLESKRAASPTYRPKEGG